jgi:hypothetical protein
MFYLFIILGKGPFENNHGIININNNVNVQLKKIDSQDIPQKLVDLCYLKHCINIKIFFFFRILIIVHLLKTS